MRNLFPGYFKPSENDYERIWQTGIFVFDTNVLLHAYRYSDATRQQLLTTLEALRERIWIPHQVAFEFLRNYRSVISAENKVYGEFTSKLDSIDVILKQILSFRRHSHLEFEQLVNPIQIALTQVQNDINVIKLKHEDYISQDPIKDAIANIFDGRIGSAYVGEQLDEKIKEAKARIQNQVPPGFKDEKSKNDPTGDVLLWFQILDYANQHKLPIIFITDDDKEDWWLLDDKKRKISPRPELVNELFSIANVQLLMYSTELFLQRAKSLLDVPVEQSTLKEVHEINRDYVISSEPIVYWHDIPNDKDEYSILSFQIKLLYNQMQTLRSEISLSTELVNNYRVMSAKAERRGELQESQDFYMLAQKYRREVNQKRRRLMHLRGNINAKEEQLRQYSQLLDTEKPQEDYSTFPFEIPDSEDLP